MEKERIKKEGCVYTKRWIVDGMLDLIGYRPKAHLTTKTIIEPSCGDGSFLMSIVERLLESAKTFGDPANSLVDAICAYEVDDEALSRVTSKLSPIIAKYGFDPSFLLSKWLRQGDFLTTEKPKADFVIGNPPYIRASNLSREKRETYIAATKTMTMGTDIYVGFIEQGLSCLKEDGRLCFICADRWMQNGYGGKLRAFIRKGYSLETVLKMSGVDCFDEKVSAYPAIMVISAKTQVNSIFYADCETGFGPSEMPLLVHDALSLNDNKRPNSYTSSILSPKVVFGDKGWSLGSNEILTTIKSIEERSLTADESKIDIGIGMATGAGNIYIVDHNPGIEESRLLPTVMPDDIEYGKAPEKPLHWIVNPWDDNGDIVNLDSYPLLKDYFLQSQQAICKRHVATKHEREWYRTIDKVKVPLIGKPKLLIADLLVRSEPIYDGGELYPSHGFYWVTSEVWDLYVLGGLLFSDLINSFVSAKGVKMRGKTIRFQAQYLKMLHFPSFQSLSDECKAVLSLAFEKRDRKMANKGAVMAYNLSKEEQEVLNL